ncbi:IS4/Tn5 family transposase DNA-binding protein [Novosphingobium rosa]|uniref:IS4/Tn5 family transposase DNA-binding protein n=1 Tax=Novosphingobium rosa TaxID=76978 RepID=UPI001C3FA36A
MANDRDEGETWIDGEIDITGFGDARLGDRLRKLMCCLDSATGQPLPLACEDWANTKAAYRFLSNSSASEEHILAGHFQATARRAGLRGHPASAAGYHGIRLPALGTRQHWLHQECEQRAR